MAYVRCFSEGISGSGGFQYYIGPFKTPMDALIFQVSLAEIIDVHPRLLRGYRVRMVRHLPQGWDGLVSPEEFTGFRVTDPELNHKEVLIPCWGVNAAA